MVKHKKITWKAPPERQVAKFRTPYIASPAIPDAFHEHLEVGALWCVAKPLAVQDLGRGFETPPFPYLVHHTIPLNSQGFYPNTKFFNPHTPAIYAGTTRVEEDQKGRVVTVPRHLFLIGDCRYIIRSLDYVVPFLKPTPSSP
jgi:hypothetical protein